jgi:methylated-DNA-[protein]-cysteine S-methyltransferase
MRYTVFPTQMGHCGVVYRDDNSEYRAVRVFLPGEACSIEHSITSRFPDASRNTDGFPELCTRITKLLCGRRIEIPMSLVDTSVCYPFQLRVLLAERTIPRGRVASYSWLARQLHTRAVRAVGSALARNPFPLVVPCHRAVRSDGSIGGFQGGSDMKRSLLEMEGIGFDVHGRVLDGFTLKAEKR